MNDCYHSVRVKVSGFDEGTVIIVLEKRDTSYIVLRNNELYMHSDIWIELFTKQL